MRGASGGFTLIEAMIVVSIIGLLTSIAFPVFSDYVRRTKSSEATGNLKLLYQSAAVYYATFRTSEGITATTSGSCTVGSTSGTLPATPGSQKQRVDFSLDASFHDLGFAIADPVFFGFGIQAASAGCDRPASTAHYTFYARSDLDGDAELALFELAAGSNASNELYRAPGFYIESEGE